MWGLSEAGDGRPEGLLSCEAAEERSAGTGLFLTPPRSPAVTPVFVTWRFGYWSATSPSSPVRMRITSATGIRKIFPSPISPVRAASAIVVAT